MEKKYIKGISSLYLIVIGVIALLAFFPMLMDFRDFKYMIFISVTLFFVSLAYSFSILKYVLESFSKIKRNNYKTSAYIKIDKVSTVGIAVFLLQLGVQLFLSVRMIDGMGNVPWNVVNFLEYNNTSLYELYIIHLGLTGTSLLMIFFVFLASFAYAASKKTVIKYDFTGFTKWSFKRIRFIKLTIESFRRTLKNLISFLHGVFLTIAKANDEIVNKITSIETKQLISSKKEQTPPTQFLF
ncbi:hypothetical protein [[Acholeplasma] multilocale]|uniref:hypothetical protein n=1 Tax=[Acholeplasma] multilocale TaxID=264638 RepID=UPI000479CFFE|nr:hypothetical protein [[Acholeplasma] multilocale]